MDNFLNSIKKDSKIAIFSTTIIAKHLLDMISKERCDIEVLYFIDSFKEGYFQNIPIITPQDAVSKKDVDLYIIASFSNGNKLASILKKAGVKNILKLTQKAYLSICENIATKAGKAFNKDSVSERYYSGHYYSAVPSSIDFDEFLAKKDDDKLNFEDIELNMPKQLKNLKHIEETSKKLDLPFSKQDDRLYYLDNFWFHPYDAYVHASMMLEYKPARIIEIGSGFSTGLMLDINKQFFDNNIEITCIEPNPERLKEVIKNRFDNIKFYEKRLQEIDLSIFETLKDNDMLFVDSSHVVKMNSDVLKIFFEILPKLHKNVIIHFHDIFNNFSYPTQWVLERRCWNETFLLRAFLQYNKSFSIEYFSDYMRAYIQQNNIETNLPINQGSGSIYLRKEI